MHENMKYFSNGIVSNMTEKQKAVIAQYESVSKLRGVMKWKERMVRHGITGLQIAQDIGAANTRVSEYINFKRQPSEKKYLAIEDAIYKRES